MAYVNKSEIIEQIKNLVITFNSLFHADEEKVYTNVTDWLFATAVNLDKPDAPDKVETRATIELYISDDDKVICIDDHNVRTELSCFTRPELLDILYMLNEAYTDLQLRFK